MVVLHLWKILIKGQVSRDKRYENIFPAICTKIRKFLSSMEHWDREMSGTDSLQPFKNGFSSE